MAEKILLFDLDGDYKGVWYFISLNNILLGYIYVCVFSHCFILDWKHYLKMIVLSVNASLKYDQIQMSENKFDIATSLKEKGPTKDFLMGQSTWLNSKE